ncbi:MAG TPA: DUF6249 domain-containing protein [Candidatus Baltobacteraceae bacterium]|nr:DUF6249 domain-containing protein [Candidatus Baltobacteraceae bacterium]
MPEVVVPVAFFFFVIGLPMTVWMISRVLAHQERMEMIRRGITPPPIPPDPRMMRKAMRYGAWPPPGPGPAAGFPYYDPGFYAQQQLRRGIQVSFIGLALLIGLSFIGYHNGTYVYGPWLLGGLIPMFVGIAQVIGAVLSGAKIGSFGTVTAPGAYQGQEPEASPAGSTASNMPPPPTSPYAGWRPGPTPEIQKPPSPPDYRP